MHERNATRKKDEKDFPLFVKSFLNHLMSVIKLLKCLFAHLLVELSGCSYKLLPYTQKPSANNRGRMIARDREKEVHRNTNQTLNSY